MTKIIAPTTSTETGHGIVNEIEDSVSFTIARFTTLYVTGVTTMASIAVSGALTAGSVAATGAVSGGSLAVTGTSALAATTSTVAGIAMVQTPGIVARNTTASLVTEQQERSPWLGLEWHAWNTVGAADEKWEAYFDGWGIPSNPTIGVVQLTTERADGTKVPTSAWVNNNGTLLYYIGNVTGDHVQFGLAGVQRSTKATGNAADFDITGQEASEAAAVTGGAVNITAGAGSGAGSTGGTVTIKAGSGIAAAGEAVVRGAGGNPVVRVDSDKIAFYNTAPAAKPTVAGAKVDAVAGSILAALVSLGLVTDTTT